MEMIYDAWGLTDAVQNKQVAAGWNIMPDLALFDAVFHWLQLGADYENTSTPSRLCGLNIENFKAGRWVWGGGGRDGWGI